MKMAWLKKFLSSLFKRDKTDIARMKEELEYIRTKTHEGSIASYEEARLKYEAFKKNHPEYFKEDA